MLSRFTLALSLIALSLPALAAEPQPQPTPVQQAAPEADPLEAALGAEWVEAERVHVHVTDALRRLAADRRAARAQLARALELCGDRCQPPAAAPQAQAAPGAAKTAEAPAP